jgi:hypothetical protein
MIGSSSKQNHARDPAAANRLPEIQLQMLRLSSASNSSSAFRGHLGVDLQL